MKKNRAMQYLNPIFSNTVGETFLIRDFDKTQTDIDIIQLLLVDVAILLSEKQLASLLKTVISARNGCFCEECMGDVPKSIKFDTHSTAVIFKSDETNLAGLEALLEGTIFELEFNAVLYARNICS